MSRRTRLNRCVGALAGAALIAPALLAGISPAVASAEACPNEALRVGLSTNLPECRAYELVSPVEKNGGDVDGHLTVQSAPDGDGVVYGSGTALPGSVTSIAGGFDIARRTPGGWLSQGLEAPQLNETSTIFTTTEAVSEDLKKSLVVSRLALAPGAIEGNGNIYLQDNETGQRTFVSGTSNQQFYNFITTNSAALYFAGTPDLSHMVLESGYVLSPGGGEETPLFSGTNVYEWSAATAAKLANVLPGGSEETSGARVVTEIDAGTQGAYPMSGDGSRIVFQTSGGIYLRLNGSSTRLISGSQRTGDDPTEPHHAILAGMSKDGSTVYFFTEAQLTNDAGAAGGLYRYEVASGRLEDITLTTEPEAPGVSNVLMISDDGSYVYYTASGVLAAGAAAGPNLYVWHDGTTKLVAAVEGPGQWSGSPNGKWFAFASLAQPTGYDNRSTACPGSVEERTTNICSEVFAYSAEADQLTCVTCNPAGKAHGGSDLGSQTGLISRYLGRRMLDDGQLFFDSQEALVPSDSNGMLDVYEWSPAGTHLISAGTANQEAQLDDATPNGSDVYFRTRQQLVGQDTDESADLYDARVNGGFSPPLKESACSGAACQGVPPAAPIFATPPSVTYNGVGNFDPPAKPAIKPKKKSKAKAKAKKHKAKPRKQSTGKKAKKSSRSNQGSTRRAGR